MNSPSSAWRRFDRYLLRNHPVAWGLHLHEVHAFMLVVTAAFCPVVWMLSREVFLEYFYWIRYLVLVLLMAGAYFIVMRSEDRQSLLPNKRRWRYLLFRWYSLIVFVSPVLFVSLMAQVRAQTMASGYVLNASPGVAKSCEWKDLEKGITQDACLDAVSKFSGRPRDQINLAACVEAFRLASFFPDSAIVHWISFLLILLCMNHMQPDAMSASAGVVFPIFSVFYGLYFGVAYPIVLAVQPSQRSSWLFLTGIAVPLLFSIVYVSSSSERRRGPVLSRCWIVVLMGLPSLVLWVPALLSSPEHRLLHQAVLLGCFLLLTPWLQRTHDHVLALPE